MIAFRIRQRWRRRWTNATGAYALALPAGTYRLVASDAALRYAFVFAGGTSFETATQFVEHPDSIDRVDLRVTPGVRLNGTVADSTGARVSGILVTAFDASGNRVAMVNTSTAGAFDVVLLPGTYRLTATDPQARYGAVTIPSIVIAAATPPQPVTLVLLNTLRRRTVTH